jgi:hypothetical protein
MLRIKNSVALICYETVNVRNERIFLESGQVEFYRDWENADLTR